MLQEVLVKLTYIFTPDYISKKQQKRFILILLNLIKYKNGEFRKKTI